MTVTERLLSLQEHAGALSVTPLYRSAGLCEWRSLSALCQSVSEHALSGRFATPLATAAHCRFASLRDEDRIRPTRTGHGP